MRYSLWTLLVPRFGVEWSHLSGLSERISDNIVRESDVPSRRRNDSEHLAMARGVDRVGA